MLNRSHTWLKALGPEMAYEVRTTSLALSVRTLIEQLPRALELRAVIGGELERLPFAARQLLKLALSSSQVILTALEQPPDETLSITLVVDEQRSRTLDAVELERPLIEHIFSLAATLFVPHDLGAMLRRLAFSTAAHETQSIITDSMLRTQKLEDALYIMLSGITSGDALGFHRAVFFRYQPQSECFVGEIGIGPMNGKEASAIWESLEMEERDFGVLLQEALKRRPESRFHDRVQTLRLTPTDHPEDELCRALEASHALLLQAPALNPDLAALDLHGSFVLAPARSAEAGECLGLVFADLRFSHASIRADQLQHFDLFTRQSILVWENLLLRKRIELHARQDALTGALNRRAFSRVLEELVSAQTPCALIVIDLDHFKAINDQHGHIEGDRRLCVAVDLLRQTSASDDAIGRFGGDEFVVIAPRLSGEALAQRILTMGRVARQQNIGLSIGAATFPDEAEQSSALFAAADRKLYEAKKAGRGCGCYQAGSILSFS